ncbi:MAG: N-acetylneuraminate synthase [Candidatus Methanofastidiosum sp.]|nr:N-acetylneuraminate synthase [Methanofastidiosum sp.]
MKNFNIDGSLVGDNSRCYIIAEAGVNHNGDVNIAKELISEASRIGADAIKFQTFYADDLLIENTGKANYQKTNENDKETQYEMIKKLELNQDDFIELYEYSLRKNITFLSSPFDLKSVDFLDSTGISAFKIASGEITNIPLIEHISSKKKPILLSTGMSNLDEIRSAIKAIKKSIDNIILLHCISSYPTKYEDANLRVIKTLKSEFNLPVGFSDHTIGITVPIAAVALGACIIEKHFTISKKYEGPDHKISLDPEEFRNMIDSIRIVEKALGNGVKVPTNEEEEMKKIVRKSIVSKYDLAKGTIITKDLIDIKRPGIGIESKYIQDILGRKTVKEIKKNQLLSWDLIS